MKNYSVLREQLSEWYETETMNGTEVPHNYQTDCIKNRETKTFRQMI